MIEWSGEGGRLEAFPDPTDWLTVQQAARLTRQSDRTWRWRAKRAWSQAQKDGRRALARKASSSTCSSRRRLSTPSNRSTSKPASPARDICLDLGVNPTRLEPFFSAMRILQASGLTALAVAEHAIDFCDDDFGTDPVLRQNCIDCVLAIVEEVFVE